jgi:UDP-N-acetylmuramate--alanine ligase
MNDYGHHPTEIRATLRAVRECFATTMNQLVVLFQPHRYTRTEGCWNEYLTCFKDADRLLLTEIYAASEAPMPGITGENLHRAVEHEDKAYLPQIEEAPLLLLSMLKPGDVVVCQGAGSVGAMPEKILSAIEQSDIPQVHNQTAVAAGG